MDLLHVKNRKREIKAPDGYSPVQIMLNVNLFWEKYFLGSFHERKKKLNFSEHHFTMYENMEKNFQIYFSDEGPYHKEKRPLIFRRNQWTGFFMIRTSFLKELKDTFL